ncbi:MAG: transcription elongation factor GreA [Eubacteriales bacterium]|nr:transcription elongation factor GreA [bacterium]MDY2793191.1 transcription elongation factor GreA [Eubacteriales bacterium]
MSNVISLSKEGYAKLEARLHYLLTTGREENRKEIEIAKGFGDLSENAEYTAAREAQARIEGEILDIQDKLQHCVIVEEDEDASVASIGSIVRVFDEEYEEEDEYRLVGATEADPKKLYVSNESPIGKALLGVRKGDSISVETPGGLLKLRVLDVRKA